MRHVPPSPPAAARAAAGSPEESTVTGLDHLNTAPPAVAEGLLITCCASRRWARTLAAHRPYPDAAALLAAAEEASFDLAPDDVAEALAGETAPSHSPAGAPRPRTPAEACPVGPGTAGPGGAADTGPAGSRTAGSRTAGTTGTAGPVRPGTPEAAAARRPGAVAAQTALRAAHAAYESRFGHAFVICLDGVATEESLDHVLAGIRARLGHAPEKERGVAAEELRRLALGRLARLAAAVPER